MAQDLREHVVEVLLGGREQVLAHLVRVRAIAWLCIPGWLGLCGPLLTREQIGDHKNSGHQGDETNNYYHGSYFEWAHSLSLI
ncbi:MAG: hypothetical protein Phyf2KO_12070 [Phycisphaerales bacterium]